MRLTGPQFRELQEALLDAFTSYAGLERMVRFGLNENLNAIANNNTDLNTAIFALIQWAESRGRLGDLLQAARDANPGNLVLAQCASLQGIAGAIEDLRHP